MARDFGIVSSAENGAHLLSSFPRFVKLQRTEKVTYYGNGGGGDTAAAGVDADEKHDRACDTKVDPNVVSHCCLCGCSADRYGDFDRGGCGGCASGCGG
ncbi:unnamed protein product [Spirodela intermedia]|uniref:Uncharacterized protein n=1 Tax=Spirodela intermedia TaxID=51605 RepID=A0A7I8JKT7_SPIIN|nr:unnamed protein product [Spirodela intermedia]CAA6670748.1 unnamed protein product [Spirodela intermedia]